MRPTVDKEILTRVDPRTLSSHRGYIQSVLAPIQIRHDGIPAATVYGKIVFDAVLIASLADSVARRLTSSKSVFDLVRYVNPWQGIEADWRQAKSIKDLFNDDVFAEHIQELVIEYDRLRGRPPSIFDSTGHPSLSLITVILSVLENLENFGKGPDWSRLGLELWPVNTVIPKGYLVSDSRPPHSSRDMFTYLFRVYDIDFALDILPESHTRSFTHTLLSRSSQRNVDISDLVDSATGQPTVQTLSASAEGLVRGILKISQIVPFIKRRIAEKRSSRIAIPSVMVPSGLISAVHDAFIKIINIDRDFTSQELEEVLLQVKIHPDDPLKIAKIIHILGSDTEQDGALLVRHGSIIVARSIAEQEGIAM